VDAAAANLFEWPTGRQDPLGVAREVRALTGQHSGMCSAIAPCERLLVKSVQDEHTNTNNNTNTENNNNKL
jgi:hypothetical protein